MSEETEPGSERDYDEDPVEEAPAGRGDEGVRAAQAAPSIGEDPERGQTQAPAPPDEVGVPSDEELAEEEAGEGD